MNSSEFEKIVGYTFSNKGLLENALTHSSYISERRFATNNERLEFLGDAFFDAIVSEELYRRLGDMEEGTLTKLRAKIVCEQSLATIGLKLKIGEYMNIGRGEEKSGGRKRESIVADAMEAVIGAIFLDGGYHAAKNFVILHFNDTFEAAISGRLNLDYKSMIQEKIQTKHQTLSYRVIKEIGPDHDKIFFVQLLCDGRLIGEGQGKSKKEAERNAAKQALERGE